MAPILLVARWRPPKHVSMKFPYYARYEHISLQLVGAFLACVGCSLGASVRALIPIM